jgi:hypothetical protein
VSAALNPDSGGGSGGTKAFQECVLIRHPRQGEFAIAFITGRTTLQAGGRVARLAVPHLGDCVVFVHMFVYM